MGSGIEIYDAQGSVLLDSTTMVLTVKDTQLLGGTGADWQEIDSYGGAINPITGQNDNNLSTSIIESTKKRNYNFDTWLNIPDGSSIMLLAQDYYAATNKCPYTLAYLSDDYPNQSDKYASAYNDQGQLMWSVGAIAVAPRVLDKINLSNTRRIEVDLSKYGYSADNLYLKSNVPGLYENSGDSSALKGLYIKRVASRLYITYASCSGNSAWSSLNIDGNYTLLISYIQ